MKGLTLSQKEQARLETLNRVKGHLNTRFTDQAAVWNSVRHAALSAGLGNHLDYDRIYA